MAREIIIKCDICGSTHKVENLQNIDILSDDDLIDKLESRGYEIKKED